MARQKVVPEVDFAPSDTEVSGIFGDLSPMQSPAGQRVITMISVDLIDPSPYQARKEEDFDPEDLEEFADTMEEEGFTSVIWVRPSPVTKGRYELLYGERRLRSAKIVANRPNPKFKDIPCEVRQDYTNAEPDRIRFLGFFENKQRKNLRASHEATYYRDLLALKNGNRPVYTLETLAKRAKVKPTYIQDRLHILELPEDVRDAYDQNSTIALRSLREVARLEDPDDRAPLLELMIAGNYSVNKLRGVVNDMLEDTDAPDQKAVVSASPTMSATSPASAPSLHLVEPVDSLRESEQVTERVESKVAPAPIRTKPTQERGQRAYKAIVSRDMVTIRDIFKRWEGLVGSEELAQLIQESAQQVQELSQPFLNIMGGVRTDTTSE